METQQRKRVVAIAAVAMAAAVAAACDSDRASILTPLGQSYDVNLANAQRNVPGGSFTFVKPGADNTPPANLTATLSGLDSLAGTAVYQLWLGKQNGAAVDAWEKATAKIVVTRFDTTFNAEGDPVVDTVYPTDTTVLRSSFFHGGSNTRVRIEVTPTSFAAIRDKDVFLITIEDNENATTPVGANKAMPFWARAAVPHASRTVTTGTNVANRDTTFTGNVWFGTFDPDPAKEYRYVPSARGVASFREKLFIVDDSMLSRPPVGYYYETHLITRERIDATGGETKDTLKIRSLGAITAPFPRRNVSLIDADISQPDPVVVTDPPQIVAAAARLSADTTNLNAQFPFAAFNEIRVTLEAKKGSPARMAPTIVLLGAVPTIVQSADDPD